MSDIIKTQRSLAIKAKYQKEHLFDYLYRLICRQDWIKDALDTILSNKGSKTAGIDGVTKKALQSNTAKAEFVKELEMELRSKQFRPMPVQGAFDSIHHQILMKLLAQRIAEKRFLKLIERFLKAGIMEGCLFKRTDTGTPQGAICSPILANIYLHQLDLYWWNKYGNLHRKEKERRRIKQMGNCALIRYADDWLLLTNGGKAEAIRLKEEFRTFLWEELKLELSPEKTCITHVNQGFDFLGFHVQRYVKSNDRPKVFVTPAQENIKKLKLKVKESGWEMQRM